MIYKEGELNKSSYKIEYDVNEDGCWICTSHKEHKKNSGYSRVIRKGKTYLTHRYVYEKENGIEITSDDVIMHTCDNPKCINPKHLRKGTQRDNIHDMYRKNRGKKLIGENNGMAKLTEKDVREIRKMNGTKTDIAKHYNVSRVVISDVQKRKSWRHVE